MTKLLIYVKGIADITQEHWAILFFFVILQNESIYIIIYNMNKFYLSIAILMASICTAMAVPAKKDAVRMQQPDGSYVTICLHGDEYLHFNTTDDGYSVVKDERGYYVYAALENGKLIPTTHVAHETATRTAEENSYLQGIQKFIAPELTLSDVSKKQSENERRAKTLARAQEYDYENFKGLIILVEYNDQDFSRDNYADIIDDMVNQPDYAGYDDTAEGQFTGSVRDYFYDNSDGIFAPQFDIVGPVKVNRSKYYANGTNRSVQLIYDVINAADSLVNFSDYDRDGDGEVDMIYFIFAGSGSNYGGNDPRLIWPHAYYVYNPNNYWIPVSKDGVRLGRYACSTELAGRESWGTLDGIGTIVHEFSHVLGLMDLYDTDYSGSGGESKDPGDWSVMAGGSYNNTSRTPTAFSIYERYALGFTIPEKITSEGTFTLEAIDNSNKGYRIDSQVNKEFFLLENRQKTSKWDQYLPGHGMLVIRVDSTNASVWNNNTVNCNPRHNYLEIVRAGGRTAPASADPFPGTRNVTTLNNTTSPANLLSWAGKETLWGLESIMESNGVISFNVVDVNILKSVTLPESVTLGVGATYLLEPTRTPDYAPYTFSWTSSDTNVATVNEEGLVTGMAPGTVTITLTANETLTATCQIIVEQLDEANSIGEFRDLTEGEEKLLHLNNAQVLFAKNTEVYVRDESGVLVLTGTGLSVNQNDILNGSIYGKYAVVNKIPYLQPVEGYTNSEGVTSAPGSEAIAREVIIDQIADTDYADLITLKGGKMERINNSIYLVGESKQVRVYNRLGVSGFNMPKDYEGKYYDVTGIMLTYMENGELVDELAIMRAPVEGEPMVDAINNLKIDTQARISVYAIDGNLVTETTTKELNNLHLKQGVYIIKSGNNVWKIAINN